MKNAENELDTIKEDINEIVDQLFARIPGFMKCNTGDAQLWLESRNDIRRVLMKKMRTQIRICDTEDCGVTHSEKPSPHWNQHYYGSKTRTKVVRHSVFGIIGVLLYINYATYNFETTCHYQSM